MQTLQYYKYERLCAYLFPLNSVTDERIQMKFSINVDYTLD